MVANVKLYYILALLGVMAAAALIMAVMPKKSCDLPSDLRLWLADRGIIDIPARRPKGRPSIHLERSADVTSEDSARNEEVIRAVTRIASKISGQDRDRIGPGTLLERELCIRDDLKTEFLMLLEEEFDKEISDRCGQEIVDIDDAARIVTGSLLCKD